MVNSIKTAILSPNGLQVYKAKIESEIDTLKAELKIFQEGGQIFHDDYIQKQKEIRAREEVLERFNLTREDYEAYVKEQEETGNKISDEQKIDLIARANEYNNASMLKTMMLYELEKIKRDKEKTNSPFQITYRGETYETVDDMYKALSENVYDLYSINHSKAIVLDANNKLNTKKGIERFIDSYIAMKDAFDNGSSEEARKSLQSQKDKELNEDLNRQMKEQGYPSFTTFTTTNKKGETITTQIPTTAVGVTMERFIPSDKPAKDMPEYKKRLDDEKAKAESLIRETKQDGKTIFTTVFSNMGEIEQLSADSKENLEKKIDTIYNRLLNEKPRVLTTKNYKLEGISVVTKGKDGKYIKTKKYAVITEDGIVLNEFTSEQLKDLLNGIRDAKSPDVVSFRLMSYEDFKKLESKARATVETKAKLANLDIAIKQTAQRISELEATLNSETFANNSTLPFADIMQQHHYRIYGYEVELKDLDKQLQNVKNQQLEFSRNYLNSAGTSNTGWASTKQNKEYKNQIRGIQAQIEEINNKLKDNLKELEQFQKENNEHAEFYKNYRDAVSEIIKLSTQMGLFTEYKDRIFQKLVDLKENKTTEGFQGLQEAAAMEASFNLKLDSLGDPVKIKDLTDSLSDTLEKEKQVRELSNLYVDVIRQHQSRINSNNVDIKELEDELEYIDSLSDESRKEIGRRNILNQSKKIQAKIADYKRQNAGIEQEIKNIQAKIEENNKLIAENLKVSGFERSMLNEFENIRDIKEVISVIGRARFFQSSIQAKNGITKKGDKNFNKYHNQRNFIYANGKKVYLEEEPAGIEKTERYKPNELFQLTGVDLTAYIGVDEEGKLVLPSEDEINDIPQIEYYRFLSEHSPSEISDKYKVMIVTPKFLKSDVNKGNPALVELSTQIDAANPTGDDTTDLFGVIIDKKTGQFIKKNGKFLTTSLYRTENKFREDNEGNLQNITEKRVLAIFKSSPTYAQAIEGKTEAEVEQYINDPQTLREAKSYARQAYENQREALAKEVNAGNVLTAEIANVTTGIFQRGENQSAAKVMGITKDNAHDFAIGVVREGQNGVGPISYIGEDGNINTIGDNIALGTTVVINKKTGQWVPLEHTKQDANSINQILGILQYTIDIAKQNKISILDAAKKKVNFGKGKFQLFANSAKSFNSEDSIPLFPVYKAIEKNRKGTENYSSRWSAITSLINWGYDEKNPKNSLYFYEDGNLQYYSFKNNKPSIISMDRLSTILDKYLNGKVDEMTEDEAVLMDDLVSALENKYKNISVQYALNTTTEDKNFPFLKPVYDAKTKEVTFKYYSSYMSYVLGLEGTTPIVTTRAMKIDGRTAFQKSIILDHNSEGTGLVLKQESSIATDSVDVNAETKKEVTREEVKTQEAAKSSYAKQDFSTFETTERELKDNEENIYYSTDGKVMFGIADGGAGAYDLHGVSVTESDVSKNQKARELFDQIKQNAITISKLSEGFEKEVLRDQNRLLYQSLVKELKNVYLTNTELSKKQIAEREAYNKDKDAKLIAGAVIEIEGDGSYTIGEFGDSIAGSSTMLSRDGKMIKAMSTNVLLQGLKEGKIKIADNKEVKPQAPAKVQTDQESFTSDISKSNFELLKDQGLYADHTYETYSQQMIDDYGLTQQEVDQTIIEEYDNIVPNSQKPLTTEKIVKENDIDKNCEV